MSFISIIGTENFITVMSDGLVYNRITGEHVQQNFKKFKKIGSKQFLAFGGDKLIAERIIQLIPPNDNEYDLNYLANSLQEKLIAEVPKEQLSCQLGIGGVENGNLVIHTVNNDPDRDILTQTPTRSLPTFSFIGSSLHSLDLDSEVNKLYIKYNGLQNPTKALKLQAELNNLVADNDISVNKVTFGLRIRL